ncbi:lipopolysaccharide biosynthesis protein [Marinobacter sp.]|uniref:lipopolysaccharide biosynthesis protein n=1 Tax=Marinobacter sp. TaxID=50741 RepID=UPI0034A267C1
MNSLLTFPRKALSRTWNSPLARNIALVSSGTAGAQLIAMAISPVVTRIYGPEAFGLLGTYLALVTVVVPFAALAYPIAIVLPEEEREALGLVKLSVVLSFVIAVVAGVLMALGDSWLATLLGAQAIEKFLILIPLAMLFAALMQTVEQWLIRKQEFGLIARTALVHSFILSSAKVGVGWLYPFGATLIALATVGHVLQAALLYIGAKRQYHPVSSSSEKGRKVRLRELLLRYRDFPLYRAPQNLINAGSQSLPVLMLAAFFGPAAAGFYTIAKMVMGMPAMLLGKAVNDVFYPRITEAARRSENLQKHIVRATGALIAIGFLPFSVMIAFGPWLFSTVFGSEWASAGEYAQWLSVFFFFNFINKPSVAAVPALGIQRGLLFYEIFSTGAKIIGLLVGFYVLNSDLWAVALFSLSGAFSYILMMVWIVCCASVRSSNEKAS